ncbi:alpha/beta hydrolase family protein [Povalibacter sp.]|uniref:alpha/beta hydrolase family protein n=1 Tax=Povalibacter sp. TaxID=1962978 RepID=UPI002F41EFEE
MKRKILWVLVAVLLVGGLIAYLKSRPEPADTRYSGAYVLHDGLFVFVAPREGRALRFRTMAGESGALWPTGANRFEGGKGWAERGPAYNTFTFEMDASGKPVALVWEQTGLEPRRASIVKLPEQMATFQSGELTLHGKLVMPATPCPCPSVVVVHGSESYSAVEHYAEPYIYAANGFATLVYDKRGTGKSTGKYSQNFRVLAGDVLAAVNWLRDQPGIDANRVHLAGFSQGGWIAPLAAARDANIKSVLIGYGPMVPVTGEDRWGYVYALHEKGFGDEAVAQADQINDVISDIFDLGANRWNELAAMLDESRDEPWFAAVKGSDSLLGMVADSRMPLWMARTYLWWKHGRDNPPFIDRLYDPVPTLAALNSPSYWILGGADSSMPTEWTIEQLEKLQKRGKPIDYLVYPDADHGILRFETGKDGSRTIIGYEPDYFRRQIDWLKRTDL